MKHFFLNAFDMFFPKRQTKLKTRKNSRVGPAAQIIEVQQHATKDDSRQCRSSETTEETTVEVHQMNEIICNAKNLTPKVSEMTAIEI